VSCEPLTAVIDRSCRPICSDALKTTKKPTYYVAVLAKPIVLRTTYGIAAEPNRRNVCVWNSMITWPCCPWLFQTRKFRRFGFSVVFWLNNTSYSKSV